MTTCSGSASKATVLELVSKEESAPAEVVDAPAIKPACPKEKHASRAEAKEASAADEAAEAPVVEATAEKKTAPAAKEEPMSKLHPLTLKR